MKFALRSLGILSLIGVSPMACSSDVPDVAVMKNLCAQMGFETNSDGGILVGDDGKPLGKFEFRAVGTVFDEESGESTGESMGSFEPNFSVPPGALIADDDDLSDDYFPYQSALKQGAALMATRSDLVAVYEGLDPDKDASEYTEQEQAAFDFVSGELVIHDASGTEMTGRTLLVDDDGKIVVAVVAEDESIEVKYDEFVVSGLNEYLIPLCRRLEEGRIGAQPGDKLTEEVYPSFTACKDKFDANGDGVIGDFILAREGAPPQDLELAACPTVEGRANTQALNFWGPLSTQPSEIENLPANPRDGFTYSGLTVPLNIAPYRGTIDRSDWQGIAFWARLAGASEAIEIKDSPGGKTPYSGRRLPQGAAPQEGVGQLGVMIQTIDTSAIYDTRGNVDGLGQAGVCEEGEDAATDFCFATQEEFDAFPGELVPLPPAPEEPVDPAPETPARKKYAYQDEHNQPQSPGTPYCIDYSPVDTKPGDETSFRNQCWDGFRSMLEISHSWRFYFMPFKNMRQAGWGRYAPEFRLDQIRSVNFLTSAFQPINVMVDEVTFYRKKKTEQPTGLEINP